MGAEERLVARAACLAPRDGRGDRLSTVCADVKPSI